MKPLSKKRLLEVESEMTELEATIKVTQTRLKELRTVIADHYHKGDEGTENFEVHGHEIKVTRRMNITITKGEKIRLQEEDPDLFDDVMKIEEKLDTTAAKERLDDLGDFVTMSQGLPTVKITKIK